MHPPRVSKKRQVAPRRLLSAAAGAAMVVLGGSGCGFLYQPTGNLLAPPQECGVDDGYPCSEEPIDAGMDGGIDAGVDSGEEVPDAGASTDPDAGTEDAG